MHKKLLVVLLSILVLASCDTGLSGDQDTSAVKVNYVKIGFDDRHNAQDTNMGNVSVALAFVIYIEDPARYSSISQLKIVEPLEGRTWTYTHDQLVDYWNDDPEYLRFEFWNRYSSVRPDYAALGTYKIIVSEEGKSDSVYEMDAYANHDPGQNTGKIYHDAHASDPSILKAPTSISAVKNDATISIDFTITGIDEQIEYVFLWIYNAEGTRIAVDRLAWPLEETQHDMFTAKSTQVSAENFSNIASVVVGFLSEKTSDTPPEGRMMYRYLHRVTF